MTNRRTLIVGLFAFASLTLPSHGEVINFDEFAPTNGMGSGLGDQYSHMGVHFWGRSHTWGGASNGNPGGFGVDGTNGPQFLGIELQTIDMHFDTTITQVQIDVTAGFFPDPSSVFTIVGYLGLNTVASSSESFGFGESWRTVSLDGVFDRITMSVSARANPQYAVDNFRWNTVPAPSGVVGLALGGLMITRRRR